MMLKLEFQDARTCRLCGAPAEQIGSHWQDSDGTRHFKAYPITDRGSRFTHVCTRNNMETPEGKPTDDPKFFYACPALRDIDTVRVPHDKMWGRCYVGGEVGEVPEPVTEEVDRVTQAAGGVR